MRAVRFFAIAAISCLGFSQGLASETSRSHSPFVHSAWSRCIQRAEAAAQNGEYNRAFSFLHGGLYQDGVSVGIDATGLGDQREAVQRATGKAIHYWRNALGDDCPIRYAVPGSEPDTIIRLVDHIEGDGDELGLIEMKKHYSWSANSFSSKTTAKISIMRSFEGKQLSEAELTEVIAHEIGHLLGLADVEETGYLMGPLDRSSLTQGPTLAEKQALVNLREELRNVHRSITQLSARRKRS